MKPTENIQQALSLFVNNRTSELIVEENNKPAGIITTCDFLPEIVLVDSYYEIIGNIRATVESSITKQETLQLAKDIMNTDLVTVTKDSELADVAWIMAKN